MAHPRGCLGRGAGKRRPREPWQARKGPMLADGPGAIPAPAAPGAHAALAGPPCGEVGEPGGLWHALGPCAARGLGASGACKRPAGRPGPARPPSGASQGPPCPGGGAPWQGRRGAHGGPGPTGCPRAGWQGASLPGWPSWPGGRAAGACPPGHGPRHGDNAGRARDCHCAVRGQVWHVRRVPRARPPRGARLPGLGHGLGQR